jgi:signal transduction histidine kinase
MRIDFTFNHRQLVWVRILPVLVASFVSLSCGNSVHAKTVHDFSDDYMVEHWNVKDGIPGTQVISIAQSTDGYIWIGTHYGVARFDGDKFTVFDDVTEGIPTGSCRRILAGPKDSLWMKIGPKLVHYSKGRFTTHPTFEAQFPLLGRLLCVTSQGNLILGTVTAKSFKASIVEISPTQLIRTIELPNTDSKNRHQFRASVDISGQIYCRFGSSLGKLTESGFTPEVEIDAPIFDITASSRGGIWIASENGISRYQSDQISEDEISINPTTPFKIIGIQEDQSGSVWVFTSDRMGTKFSRTEGTRYRQTQEIHLASRSKTLIDHENHIWLAKGLELSAEKSGLFRLRERQFRHTKSITGLEGNIRAFAQTSPSTFFIGTSEGIFAVPIGSIQPEDWTSGPFQKIQDTNCWSLHPSSDDLNSLWSGSYSLGGNATRPPLWHVFYDVPTSTSSLEKFSLLNAKRITALCENQEGELWIGDRTEGLFRFKDGEIAHINSEFAELPSEIQSLANAKDNTLWIGTSLAGLFRLRNQSLHHFRESDGCPEGQIRALHVDQENTLWIAFGGRGIYRYKDSKFVGFTTDNGLPTNEISTIIDDELGYLWFGSFNGIHRVKKSDMDNIASGNSKILFVDSFDEADGLSTMQCSSGHPSSYRTSNGQLWFATVAGANVVNPRSIPNRPTPPPVRVESIVLDGVSYDRNALTDILPEDEVAHISAGINRIEIHYTAINFSDPEEVRFRYRLEGVSNAWIEIGNQRSVVIPRLSPGSYRFLLQAANSDGVWNIEGVSLSLNVEGQFWERTSFQVLFCLTFIAIIAAGLRLRWVRSEQRQVAKAQFARDVLEHQESDRKRIANELHDSLEQNLLVIKNHALLTQQRNDHSERITKVLDNISTISTDSIEEVRRIASNLRPYQIDRLGLSKAIQGMLNQIANATNLSIEHEIETTPHDLSPELQINLYRIVQEATNNILKHAQATQTTITLLVSDYAITLRIRDNGKGFNTEETQRDEGKGFGINGIHERAAMLKGTSELKTAPGHGTEWVIRFPR